MSRRPYPGFVQEESCVNPSINGVSNTGRSSLKSTSTATTSATSLSFDSFQQQQQHEQDHHHHQQQHHNVPRFSYSRRSSSQRSLYPTNDALKDVVNNDIQEIDFSNSTGTLNNNHTMSTYISDSSLHRQFSELTMGDLSCNSRLSHSNMNNSNRNVFNQQHDDWRASNASSTGTSIDDALRNLEEAFQDDDENDMISNLTFRNHEESRNNPRNSYSVGTADGDCIPLHIEDDEIIIPDTIPPPCSSRRSIRSTPALKSPSNSISPIGRQRYSKRRSVRFQEDDGSSYNQQTLEPPRHPPMHNANTSGLASSSSMPRYVNAHAKIIENSNMNQRFALNNVQSRRQQQEEDDLALARLLQQQEEQQAEIDEEEQARLVQMLLDTATESRQQQQQQNRHNEASNAMRPRIVEYVAPDEIPDEQPPFSLVPDSLFSGDDIGCNDKKDVCAICYEALSSGTAVVLRVCGHIFHLDCIDDMLQHTNHCPHCRKCVKQEPQGKSPSGTMIITHLAARELPQCVVGAGFPSNMNIIKIEYSIPDGFQKEYHDNASERFRGCTKVAYLPDSTEGRVLLERLIYAFSRGLTFQIGSDKKNPSKKDTVQWANIPHMSAALNEKDDIQYLYYVSCHEALDQLGVP